MGILHTNLKFIYFLFWKIIKFLSMIDNNNIFTYDDFPKLKNMASLLSKCINFRKGKLTRTMDRQVLLVLAITGRNFAGRDLQTERKQEGEKC